MKVKIGINSPSSKQDVTAIHRSVICDRTEDDDALSRRFAPSIIVIYFLKNKLKFFLKNAQLDDHHRLGGGVRVCGGISSIGPLHDGVSHRSTSKHRRITGR